MGHLVSQKLGVALDEAIKVYGIEVVLDIKKEGEMWEGVCEPLKEIPTLQFAKYLIEGYDYPKSTEESVMMFVEWFDSYNEHVHFPTKNSSYRRGRRHTLEEVKNKLMECSLLIPSNTN